MTAISVNKVAKCYPIYDRPSDRLKQMLFKNKKRFFREFWALNNVNFSVSKGETVGIIGKNGSGKSTLLQIICKILTPTKGDVKVDGKVAALLELGAGFNPEFSGIENIFMAASIYGLTKEETSRRMDSIISFADIGEHLDQPVKTYSSGMYVRLAFAVIAHVDADILVIDEALAVGDAIFTQKCMRFIREFKKTGTLLFVSHDMNSVLSLCDKAIWLDNGTIVQQGSSKQVAEDYLQSTLQSVYGNDAQLERVNNKEVPEPSSADVKLDYDSQLEFQENLVDAKGWSSGAGKIISIEMKSLSNEVNNLYKGGEKVNLIIRAEIYQDFDRPIIGFLVRDRLGQDLFGENTLGFTKLSPTPAKAGDTLESCFTFTLPMLPNGEYVVMASLANGDLYNNIQHHWLHDAFVLTVSSSKVRWGLVGIPFEQVSLNKI